MSQISYAGHPIDMVWIDLDDTLIDFTTNSKLALTRLYRTERLDRQFVTPELWVKTYERYNMALWDEYNHGQISREYLRHERFSRPLLEGGFSPDEVEVMARRFDTLYLDYLALERTVVPGAMELLRGLREAGVPVGVLSNGFSEVQYRKMDRAGITPYVDLTVLSDEIDVNKPDRRLFDYAVARASALLPDVSASPERHLMIGDNPDTDIAGALDAGWQALWFDFALKGPEATPAGALRCDSLPAAGVMLGLSGH